MGLILRMDVGNAVIDRSTRILREQTGFDVVTPNNMTYKIGQIAKHGTLIINGHGNQESLGGYSAADLAALLAQHKLPSPVNIELIACNTGFGGAPYALELKVELAQKHKTPATVSAPTRYVAVAGDGQRRTLDATFAANGAVTSVTPVATGVQVVNTPWGPQKKRSGTSYASS